MGREVGPGIPAAEGDGSGVVGAGRGLRRVEGAEPDPGLLPGVPDLGSEPAPWPLPDAAEPRRPVGYLGS